MKALYFGDTNVGNVRSWNEDRFVLNEVWGGRSLLGVVIDGVGGDGNGHGRLAAERVAEYITKYFEDCEYNSKSMDVLQAAVINANNFICGFLLKGMKCVLSAVLIDLETGSVDVVHCGDSRVYTFKDGVLCKKTVDDSVVSCLEDSGRITEYEAMRHPQRNVITRCIGSELLQFGTDYIHTYTFQAEPSFSLLLCSDGLYDMVHSSQMTLILNTPLSVEERVGKLIDAALEAGGRDNVTVIIIDLVE